MLTYLCIYHTLSNFITIISYAVLFATHNARMHKNQNSNNNNNGGEKISSIMLRINMIDFVYLQPYELLSALL